jgi:hypothetical protein
MHILLLITWPANLYRGDVKICRLIKAFIHMQRRDNEVVVCGISWGSVATNKRKFVGSGLLLQQTKRSCHFPIVPFSVSVG